MSHRIREAMRSGSLTPPIGGEGRVVEIDETIYGRASTHPKGRKSPNKKLTNSAHKNVILSLVERGGSVRSYHVAGSTVSEVIPVVNANVRKETFVMTDSAQLYKRQLSTFASHDRVDHSAYEYVRYVEGAKATSASLSAACAVSISIAQRSTCTVIWRSSTFAITTGLQSALRTRLVH